MIFERKVNCMVIYLVTVKKKFGFSSNMHVLYSRKALSFG